MLKKQITYQMVPHHYYRANLVERAIQTFENHLKAGLSTLHPNFPIVEWDRLLPQAFLTLNLLQPSTVNPNLSAYAYLFRQFDFNKTPLASPWSKALIHTKPSNRTSWDLNGKIGFYTGPALNYYRCMTCFIPSTRKEIVADTLVYIPHIIQVPTITTDNFLTQETSDIITLLTCPPSNIHSTLQIRDSIRNGLLQLATLLNTAPDVINNQEQQQLTVAAAINRNNKQIPTHTTTNNNANKPSFPKDIKYLQSAFFKLINALNIFKQLLQKQKKHI